jgi:hypothetical protein
VSQLILVPHRHWRRALACAAAVIGTVAIGATGVVVGSYLFRDRPGPRSVSSALKQFRQDAATTAAPTTAVVGAIAGRPTAGVYQLAGQGSEHISFPPNSQSDGAIMPASVVYLSASCWRWRVDYNVAHWEDYDFCSQGGVLRETANRNGQTWDFGTTKITNQATFACPAGVVVMPADLRPGETFSQSCTGTNTAVSGVTQATGPIRIVGTERLTVGNRAVTALHEVQQISLVGGQTGSVSEDWWFEVGTGLPVRVDRYITIGTKSPVGTITYTESGSWGMTSLTPQT